MERRTFITAGITAGMTAIAGCTGGFGDRQAPPRKSNVIDDISLESNATVVAIEPEPQGARWIKSRRDIDDFEQPTPQTTVVPSIRDLSPVGVASAKGRGARGRGAKSSGSKGYSSAPKTKHGRARLYGGPYVNTYYDDHEEEIEEYPVTIEQVGVAYLGTNEQFQETAPGPGPVSWDQTYSSDINGVLTIEAEDIHNNGGSGNETLKNGWYRISTNVGVPKEDGGVLMAGWESVDLRVEPVSGEKEITERWKVSPRI